MFTMKEEERVERSGMAPGLVNTGYLIFELTEFDAVMNFQNRGACEAVNRQLSKEPLIKRYSVIIRVQKKIEHNGSRRLQVILIC
jgi:hypothetical protein